MPALPEKTRGVPGKGDRDAEGTPHKAGQSPATLKAGRCRALPAKNAGSPHKPGKARRYTELSARGGEAYPFGFLKAWDILGGSLVDHFLSFRLTPSPSFRKPTPLN